MITYIWFFFASRKNLYVRRTKELIIKDFIFTVYDLKFVLLNFDMKSFYWALEMNRKVWLTEQDYEIYNSEKFNHIFLSLTNWISRIAEFNFQASIKKKNSSCQKFFCWIYKIKQYWIILEVFLFRAVFWLLFVLCSALNRYACWVELQSLE